MLITCAVSTISRRAGARAFFENSFYENGRVALARSLTASGTLAALRADSKMSAGRPPCFPRLQKACVRAASVRPSPSKYLSPRLRTRLTAVSRALPRHGDTYRPITHSAFRRPSVVFSAPSGRSQPPDNWFYRNRRRPARFIRFRRALQTSLARAIRFSVILPLIRRVVPPQYACLTAVYYRRKYTLSAIFQRRLCRRFVTHILAAAAAAVCFSAGRFVRTTSATTRRVVHCICPSPLNNNVLLHQHVIIYLFIHTLVNFLFGRIKVILRFCMHVCVCLLFL